MTQATEPKPLVINGWTIFAHPLFLDQLEELDQKVEAFQKKDPKDWMKKNAAKRQAAVLKVAFELIPQDPTHARFRQGDTLGDEYKHWFRAKFLQQYRLFFRYDVKTKTILLAWVNDEDTKRAYESDTDAYKTFRKMLKGGNPPDSWNALLKEGQAQIERLAKVAPATE
jgi:toxin YhaV